MSKASVLQAVASPIPMQVFASACALQEYSYIDNGCVIPLEDADNQKNNQFVLADASGMVPGGNTTIMQIDYTSGSALRSPQSHHRRCGRSC